MTVLYKEGVIGDLNQGIRRAKGRITKLYDKYGDDLIITSKRDGTHGPGSCHPEGDAIDFRYGHAPRKEIKDAAGNDCDIVFHTSHIHCEYDPKQTD